MVPVSAAEGKVTYGGRAKDFIFEPGSEHSPTDLFSDFKDVMPGDRIPQKIRLKNEADQKVKVKIYLRALGAQEDSAEFLSQLDLQVQKSGEMAYLFDATADERAQLTDWVCLGTLYSGGEVDLDVTLSVPVELDNRFQSQVGALDWEFKAEEYPIESGDPKPTGDDAPLELWIGLFIGSIICLIALFIWKKRSKKQ